MNMIDSYDTHWLDMLKSSDETLPRVHEILLLDSVFLPGVYQRLCKRGTNPHEYHALFEGLPGSGDDALAVSPIIVEYHESDAQLHKLLRDVDGKPMVTLIRTTETAAQLASRLKPWCVVK